MEFENELKCLCPFCRQPWTVKMLLELESISAGCPTCGYGGTANVIVKIKCDHCGRVIYEKEVELT